MNKPDDSERLKLALGAMQEWREAGAILDAWWRGHHRDTDATPLNVLQAASLYAECLHVDKLELLRQGSVKNQATSGLVPHFQNTGSIPSSNIS